MESITPPIDDALKGAPELKPKATSVPIVVRLLALQIALGELGNQEIPKGSNWGKHVQKYLAAVGIPYAAPWCMAFVYWCFLQAGCKALIRTGSVLDQWHRIPQQYKSKVPCIGAIAIMYFGGGKGHTFIVRDIAAGVLHTVEGNSNDEGSREGYEVCCRERKTNDPKIIGYVII